MVLVRSHNKAERREVKRGDDANLFKRLERGIEGKSVRRDPSLNRRWREPHGQGHQHGPTSCDLLRGPKANLDLNFGPKEGGRAGTAQWKLTEESTMGMAAVVVAATARRAATRREIGDRICNS